MAKIMVIRHAEKPNGEQGVGPYGSADKDSLTPTGWKRAEALVGLFDPPGGAVRDSLIAKPTALFASAPNAAATSKRPQQTIMPLSDALEIEINLGFGLGDEVELVKAAKAAAGVVLIAWHHEKIPEIAGLILGSMDGVPPRWKAKRFDVVWVFLRGDDGAWTFSQAPELLLPGDSPKPIAADGAD